MQHTDEAIALVEEVFARWYEMGREARADPLVLAAGRKLAQMLKERMREECQKSGDGKRFAVPTGWRLPAV